MARVSPVAQTESESGSSTENVKVGLGVGDEVGAGVGEGVGVSVGAAVGGNDEEIAKRPDTPSRLFV